MAFPRDMPMTLICWTDSNRASGWHTEDDMELTVLQGELLCRSVGFLFLDAPDRIVLVGHQADTGSVGDGMTIPRSAIRSLTTLTEAPS